MIATPFQRVLRLVGCLGILAMLPAAAAEPSSETDEAISEAVKVPYSPDHLAPLRPVKDGDWRAPYRAALQTRLGLNSPFFARVTFLNSSEGEACLRLHGPGGQFDYAKTREFFLSYHVAEKSIWYSLPENNDGKKQEEVVVAVYSAPIPKEFAIRLHILWDKMLARTAPRERVDTSLDGTTYEFATPERVGEASNPRRGKSPRLFADLGYSLAHYCQAEKSKRGKELEACYQSAAALENYLENYLEKHPAK